MTVQRQYSVIEEEKSYKDYSHDQLLGTYKSTFYTINTTEIH